MQQISDLLQKRTEAILLREQKSTKQTSEIDFSKEVFCFRKAILEAEPNFDPLKSDLHILNSLFAWIWKRNDLNPLGLDFEKGLFLCGGLGLGKTMTLCGLRRYMVSLASRMPKENRDYRWGMWWKSASELANIYASEGQPALIQYADRDVNLCIDELGREPIPAKHFGTSMNVMQFLLQLRYDNRRSSVTHITTNLKLDEIAGMYGDYVADRCLEMFNFIEFSGESIR